MAEPLLSVRDLSIRFGGQAGGPGLTVVEGVSLDVERGQTVAVVGESGSGKTLTGKALMGLLPRGAAVSAGAALFRDTGAATDLLTLRARALRRLRGARISMIFQEPMSALSALHRVGPQVAEVLEVHGLARGRAARARVLKSFEEVGLPEPERIWNAYPFELSGGLRQRAVIAMAMVGDPRLVIADEPTTALDVTTQATVLDLLARLTRQHALSVLMITHDLGVVANCADAAVVLSRGRVMECGPARAVLCAPGHAYTRRLLAAAPRVPENLACHEPDEPDPILTVRGLSKTYRPQAGLFAPPARPFRAVADLDLTLGRGRVLAVVGESGSGKSTVAKAVLRAIRPDPGAEIRFCPRDGAPVDLVALSGAGLRAFRRRAQMVFQDPFAALSPRMRVRDILTEPMRIHGLGSRAERIARAGELMRRVGLPPEHMARFPNAFSGGQRQRIAIARALMLEPELVVCDEPTSALDVSVQAEVLALLDDLKREMGLSYLFISHDLAVVAKLADRVMVMRAGRVVEEGSCDCIFNDARHPYTRALIAACPDPSPDHRLDLAAVATGAGAPEDWPAPYRYRADAAPGLVSVAPGHNVRCAA